MKRLRRVPCWYRGYLMEIGCRNVEVYDPRGEMLGRMVSISTARALVRAHLRLIAASKSLH